MKPTRFPIVPNYKHHLATKLILGPKSETKKMGLSLPVGTFFFFFWGGGGIKAKQKEHRLLGAPYFF